MALHATLLVCTSLLHGHLSRSLFKDGVGLDDLWPTPASASLSLATPPPLSIPPTPRMLAISLGSENQNKHFQVQLFIESLSYDPLGL